MSCKFGQLIDLKQKMQTTHNIEHMKSLGTQCEGCLNYAGPYPSTYSLFSFLFIVSLVQQLSLKRSIENTVLRLWRTDQHFQPLVALVRLWDFFQDMKPSPDWEESLLLGFCDISFGLSVWHGLFIQFSKFSLHQKK